MVFNIQAKSYIIFKNYRDTKYKSGFRGGKIIFAYTEKTFQLKEMKFQ